MVEMKIRVEGDFRIDHVNKTNSIMPSASPSQYLCSLIEEMDHNPLQPGYEDPHMEGYTDPRHTYVQNAAEIEDILCDYNSEANYYKHHTGHSAPSGHSWNYPQIPRQNSPVCLPPESTSAQYSDFQSSTQINRDSECCVQNKQFQRIPGYSSAIPYDKQESSGQHRSQQTTQEPDFMRWTSKHPQNWSPKEVLDWLFYSADKHQVDCGLLHAENFRAVSGADLCNMGLEDFYRLEQNFGSFFYKLFRNLCDGLSFQNPCEGRSCDPIDLDDSSSSSLSPSPTNLTLDTGPTRSYENLDFSGCGPEVKMEQMGTVFYDMPPPQQQGYMCNRMTSPQVMQHCAAYQLRQQSCLMADNPCMYENLCPTTSMSSQCVMTSDVNPTQVPRRRPGRPRIKSLPSEEEALREKKVKNQHLWEFIYNILMNPMYNPQYLRWENQREGVFRFVQSEAVAQLWGSLKNNENMTYEKLSRAMRHYYKRGILERVEGRRLVYKFSSVAMERFREKRYSI